MPNILNQNPDSWYITEGILVLENKELFIDLKQVASVYISEIQSGFYIRCTCGHEYYTNELSLDEFIYLWIKWRK
jgi:hypothetical protein